MTSGDKPLVWLRGEVASSDEDKTWRIVYRVDPDAVVIAEVFQKTTPQTPAQVIANCRRRLRQYDVLVKER